MTWSRTRWFGPWLSRTFRQAGTNLRAWLFMLMHNQNVNNLRRSIREGQMVDIEATTNVLAATTDPTASRQLFELDRALGQLAAGAAPDDIAGGP